MRTLITKNDRSKETIFTPSLTEPGNKIPRPLSNYHDRFIQGNTLYNEANYKLIPTYYGYIDY